MQPVRHSNSSPVMLAGLGHAYAVLGDRREALRIAAGLRQQRGDKGLFAYELGVIHAALRDADQAFNWFERAVRERAGWIAYIAVDPRLEPLHADSRFVTISTSPQRL